MEQEFYMTRLDWAQDSNQSLWNVCIVFYTLKENWKLYVLENNNVVIYGKQCSEKPHK